MRASTLSGKGIVITRPRAQAITLARRIEDCGGRALLYPTIEIAPPSDMEGAKRALDGLPRADLAIFVSPTAVGRGMGLVRERGEWPSGVGIAAIGAGSRRVLEREGYRQILAPDEAADSEALLALPQLSQVSGKRIVIFRGEGGRDLLGDTLASRGAEVRYVQCYRRVRPGKDLAALVADWASVDAVTVFSVETLDNLVAMLGEAGAVRLRQTPLFVPHPRVADKAMSLGVRAVQVAGPGEEEMVRGLVAYFRDAK